jgi:hypothetical protein
MTISSKQYQSLQAEACRMADELPNAQLLDSLIATYASAGGRDVAAGDHRSGV